MLILTASWQTVSSVRGDDPSNARRPQDDSELRLWLENMIWHHRFSDAEVTAATGLSADEINAARAKFNIRDDNRPVRTATSPLLVLPYPGGRHPRIVRIAKIHKGFEAGTRRRKRLLGRNRTARWLPSRRRDRFFLTVDRPPTFGI